MKRLTVVLIIFILGIAVIGCSGERTSSEAIYYKEEVAVLMYHHIAEETNASTITPEQFSDHLAMFQEKGFNVISINDFADLLEGNKEVPPNALVITFDDGYRSFYHEAYPRLVEKDMPATVFVIGSKVGVTEGEVAKLTWQQMQEMRQQGMSFYSHTHDSHNYITVNAEGGQKPALVKPAYLTNENRSETREEFEQRIRLDFTRSYNELKSNLGYPVPFLALPYGWASDTALDIANQVGFDYIFTIKPGMNGKETPHNRLYRINAGNPEITAEDLFNTIISISSNKEKND